MYPSAAAAAAMTRVVDLTTHFQVGDDLWTAFTQEVGSPEDDIRLVAALPGNVVAAALTQAALPGGSPTDGGPGSTSGVSMEAGEAHHVHEGWRQLGGLDGRGPMGNQIELFTFKGAFNSSHEGGQGHEGKDTEIHAGVGPRRRWRIRSPERGRQAEPPAEVHQHDGFDARRRGRAHDRTAIGFEEEAELGEATLRRLWGVRTIRSESFEGFEVQDLGPHGGWLCLEGIARSIELHPMASLLPSFHHSHDHATGVFPGTFAWLRAVRGEDGSLVPGCLALGVRGGRDGTKRAVVKTPVEDQHGHEGRQGPSTALRQEQAMGRCVQDDPERIEILAGPDSWSSSGMVGQRLKRESTNPSGIHSTRKSTGWSRGTTTSDGVRHLRDDLNVDTIIQSKAGEPRSKGSQEKKMAGRKGGVATTVRIPKRWKFRQDKEARAEGRKEGEESRSKRSVSVGTTAMHRVDLCHLEPNVRTQ